MPKGRDNWAVMLNELTAYKAANGHSNVPAHYPPNLALGRWVSAQRYRRKVKDMPDECVRQLDALGFVWSASDLAWEEMFRHLIEFKGKYGHCNVSTQFPENPNLAGWVQRQRHRRRRNRLLADRARRMTEVGFSWAIYKSGKGRPAPGPVKEEPAAPEQPGDRLYKIRAGLYVQYDGNGRMPDALKRYLAANDEYPPYIPLPAQPAVFRIGEDFSHCRKVRWRGSGALPKEVVDYVTENGILPPHDW